jgi:hypothetical protein
MVWVDGHVHVYPCFSVKRFLAAAIENMGSGSPGATRILLLTESAGHGFFDLWMRSAGRGVPGAEEWSVERTPEDTTLSLRNPNHGVLRVVAGRQVVTSEGLEVLALGTRATFNDLKRSAEDAIEAAASAGALPAVPWGAGKWWGRRGRALSGLIANHRAPFVLCDNAGRPWVWPEPSHFRRAREKGARLLSGSDPLPLPGEESFVGRCGFTLEGEIDSARPFLWVRDSVFARPPGLYGRREGLLRFLRNQAAMQIRKGQQLR